MNSLFEYLEYRDFFKDFYDDQKGKHAFFSYRYFANKLGVDASFLVKVMQKQLHISSRTIPRVIDFFKFSDKETEYFELLVSFNKAKNNSDMKLYFEKMISLRSPRIKTVIADKYAFFTKWYNIVIYELLTFFPFKGDTKELARKINPPISVPEAKKVLALLERLEFIKKQPDGTYAVVDKLLTTGEKWQSIAINNFQKQMIELSSEALERFPKRERDISTVTLSLSKDQFELMKERIQLMRKELLEMADKEKNAARVYQVNFQIFPLTNPDNKGK